MTIKMNKTKLQLLTSHGLSTWGNSLWSFAIGLFLVILYPESLQLSAIYGLILAASILLMGSTIGFWIDHTPRLKAAKTALFVQNGAVASCAFFLCILLNYGEAWEAESEHYLVVVSQIAVVFLADVASLASEAQRIILERDWIVIIAGDDQEDLARMNSIFRSIDLTTFVVAPSLVGGIMSWMSPMAAAIFLGSWNVASLIVEYFLLINIFHQVPELAMSRSQNQLVNLAKKEVKSEEENPDDDDGIETRADSDEQKWSLIPSGTSQIGSNGRATGEVETKIATGKKKSRHWAVEAAWAWKLYWQHPVFPAGFGLACLYMTVLGFDNVTSGYLYSQGVPEWLVGVCTGIGSIFGVVGALIYPVLRSNLGLPVSAVLGFATLNVLTSGAIVASFLPGSPFELYTSSMNSSSLNSTTAPEVDQSAVFNLNPSVLTFMICLIIGRTGLWVADLSVTQSMQESVEPNLRGEINGVQSSMNYFMEVIKFGLVTALPKPPAFGYLIIASECFTIFGWACAVYYSWKAIRRAFTRTQSHPILNLLLYEKSTQRRTPSSRSLMTTWLHSGGAELQCGGDNDPVLYGTFSADAECS